MNARRRTFRLECFTHISQQRLIVIQYPVPFYREYFYNVSTQHASYLLLPPFRCLPMTHHFHLKAGNNFFQTLPRRRRTFNIDRLHIYAFFSTHSLLRNHLRNLFTRQLQKIILFTILLYTWFTLGISHFFPPPRKPNPCCPYSYPFKTASTVL